MKRIIVTVVAVIAALFVAGCSSPADTASHNLSKDSDNYKVYRQIVVYNALRDKYVLEVDGYCALGNHDPKTQVSYTCKKGGPGKSSDPSQYIKDIIQRSNNTFVFVHQLHPTSVSDAHYKVFFRPSTIIPDVDKGQ